MYHYKIIDDTLSSLKVDKNPDMMPKFKKVLQILVRGERERKSGDSGWELVDVCFFGGRGRGGLVKKLVKILVRFNFRLNCFKMNKNTYNYKN